MTLGLRACAKLLGWKHPRLAALAKEGRVPFTRNEKGHMEFDPEAVRAAFMQSTDPAQQNKLASTEMSTSATTEEGFNAARTKREFVKLKLDEISLGKVERRLIDAEQTEIEISNLHESVKSHLMLVPSKLGSRFGLDCQIAAEQEIRKAFESISRYTPHVA